MMAAMMGYSHIVKILLEKGANVSSVADPGITALHATSEGCTPLHLATEKGSPEAVRALIEAGANPDRRTPTSAWHRCTYIAARSGPLDTLRELLRLKANPLLEFEPPPSSVGCGSAPLDIAAQNGHSDIVRELVEQLGIEGCDPKKGGEPALHVAASDQHVDIMAILTGAGVVDTTGLALIGAAGHGREVSAKFLLRQRHKESKGR
ncbi:EsV-1-199 [Ectocarpus siliculosus]|uniref:EsV-1-199 n=1 Tax=Ectocarpus siliculosus TaxID=2880 RepID=D7FWJ9_ECTSI|nr:EsV-1-199 [Ectocarpus siliculosus]|eukprot:CBJ32087.1 EsV-1-199 [Ectocarpus siliculosus]